MHTQENSEERSLRKIARDALKYKRWIESSDTECHFGSEAEGKMMRKFWAERQSDLLARLSKTDDR